MNNMMLDVRALGSDDDSQLLAVGCAFFEPSTGQLGPQFYRAIDLNTVKNIDPAVVIELLKRDADQRVEIISATHTELAAVAELLGFVEKNASKHAELQCWTRSEGAVRQLISAVKRHNLVVSRIALRVCSLPTLVMLAGATGYVPHPRRSTATYVLTDAVYQAEQVCEIWQRLTSPYIESL
ncbi:3'-5' exoribonuclease domain-containing protein [Klebsiella pneumoniae]|uniref:3'-5' exoribonuclease domain-containing protein n=2 Tax=Klebsiella pneumoniae TaxID=573 RepID=UPI0024ADBB84|nr:3'-5' exoribonuclease [Klebsiella pneumoniae]HDO7029416.1 3'-5' exoribonuclease [Klebsiella pneumoniae]